MGRLQTAKKHYKNLRERVYEVLEVAAPGDVLSRVFNLGIILLVALNIVAFGLSLLDRLQPYQLYLNRFELFSVVIFSIEYLLRLWSCPASPRYAHPLLGRVSFVLRPMMLVDLVAVLPFYLPFFIALDLRLLRLLRLARLVRLFKLARYLEQPPADETAVTDLLNEYQRAMAQQRAQLNTLRDENMSQHREQVDQVIADIRRAQQLWQVRRRRGTGGEDERQAIEAPIEILAGSIGEEAWLQTVQERNNAIYQQAATLFDEAPISASLGVEIGWKNIRSFTRVPARRIGQYHFDDLAGLSGAAFARFSHSYTEETKRRLDAVRAAISYALTQGEKEQSGSLSQEVRVGLNRAVNRLRDLSDPMRAAWDGLIWELQNEQQNRIERVQIDISRYGSLMFYFGRLVRWFKYRERYLRERVIDALYEFLPQARAIAEEAYRRIINEISPALLWLGLTRTRAREVLETVDQAQMTPRQDLAEDYRKHFTFAPLETDNLFVGFDEELALIDQAIQRWESGRASSFIMYGQRGSGKTTLINIAEERLFDDDQPVTRAVVQDKIATVDALVAYLATLLELPAATDFEGLARDLLAGPRRAVLLEGCHNLFLRKIGGLEAFRHLLWLVARTNRNVLWGLCLGKYAHSYLSKFLPLNQLFHFEVAISAWKPHELRQLILLRHDQSGYSHSYAFDKELEKALRRRVRHWRRPEEPAAQEALEQIFFEELAETCGENILVALYYWLRALEPNGRDHFTVKPMRELDLDMVNNSTLEQTFILAAILHHDNLSPRETAEILDANLIQTRLQLDILDNLNVLDVDVETRRYRVNPVVLQPVGKMLAGRNLLY